MKIIKKKQCMGLDLGNWIYILNDLMVRKEFSNMNVNSF